MVLQSTLVSGRTIHQTRQVTQANRDAQVAVTSAQPTALSATQDKVIVTCTAADPSITKVFAIPKNIMVRCPFLARSLRNAPQGISITLQLNIDPLVFISIIISLQTGHVKIPKGATPKTIASVALTARRWGLPQLYRQISHKQLKLNHARLLAADQKSRDEFNRAMDSRAQSFRQHFFGAHIAIFWHSLNPGSAERIDFVRNQVKHIQKTGRKLPANVPGDFRALVSAGLNRSAH